VSTNLAQHETEYGVVEHEPPDLLARNLRTGSHLWSSATIFFFVGFLFAFFYLRVLNNAGLWRPKGVTPPLGLGTAVLVTVLLSAGVSWLALRERRAAGTEAPLDQERLSAWRLRGLLALILGLSAFVLQIVAWATLGFGPSSGGYASVYVGWTGMFAVFLLGGLFWLETLLATSIRYRKSTGVEAGEGSGDPYRLGHDVANPLALVLPGLQAFVFFWLMLALIEVVTYVLLYGVR
jgi:heme/copper-type cytochrome/quinol oxidase subunit 3